MADRIDEELVSIDGVVSGLSANAAQRVRKHLATLRAEITRLRAFELADRIDAEEDDMRDAIEDQRLRREGREAGLREAREIAVKASTHGQDVIRVIRALNSRIIRAAREGKA